MERTDPVKLSRKGKQIQENPKSRFIVLCDHLGEISQMTLVSIEEAYRRVSHFLEGFHLEVYRPHKILKCFQAKLSVEEGRKSLDGALRKELKEAIYARFITVVSAPDRMIFIFPCPEGYPAIHFCKPFSLEEI